MSDNTEAGTAGQGEEGSTSPPPPDNAAIEAQARRLGWKPWENFRGKPEDFVGAADYVERGNSMIPILQKNNRLLERRLDVMSREQADMKSIMADGLERQRRAEEVGYNRAMRELRQQRNEAVANADVARVQQLDNDIAEMGPAPPAAPQPRPGQPAPGNGQANQPPPEVAAWVRRNPWFTSDRKAQAYAQATLDDVTAEYPDWSLSEQLDEVSERVTSELGIETGRRRNNGNGESRPSTVSRSSTAAAPTRQVVKPRSFEAMPADMKARYDKELKMYAKGKGPEKEEFARYYWEQFPEDGA